MAANQRKKRLSTVSITSSREQGRAKKKKLGLPLCDLKMRSNISLMWDDKMKSVVPKREQIGITRRGLIPFIDLVPHCHSILADILAVPHEIFVLDNLKEVLPYEVWQTHLSESERNYLTQFLPKGAETHQVVEQLLAGDNFHFGNPFLKWGVSLCSGNLHPDVVRHQEQCFQTSKKSYYSELLKYHNSMIRNLLNLKERWASCKDPEKEIVHKIWRSRKQSERSISTAASRLHDAQEELAAMSESGSWAANDEKAGSSDNQITIREHGELQKRKGFMEDKYDNLSAELKVVARPRKGEKLHKKNIQCGDGSKYMSYIRVSREQHQRVKSSMKHSSNSIQSRSLNCVLGNLDTFRVQPFEVFEEEEQKKLREHWLQLATRDLPIAFANCRMWRIKKRKLAQSLKHEMEEKLKSIKEDEEKENACSMLPDLTDNRAADCEVTIMVEVEEKEKSGTLLQEQIDNGAENRKPDIALEDVEKEKSDTIFQEMADNEAAKHALTIEMAQNQHRPIPSLNGSHEFLPMVLDSDNNAIMETHDIPPNVSPYSDNLNHMDIVDSQADPLSSTSDVWPAVSMPEYCYHSSSLNHDCASTRNLSLGHSRVFKEQPAQLIDLESDNHEEDTVKDLLHRQPIDRSFFDPYPGQEVQNQNELLQHLFKGQPYPHEQKEMGLDFQSASNVSVERSQFCGHYGEQLHPSLPLELGQKRLNDIYMHQNNQEKMFSDGGRYSIPRQEHFLSVNVQDWAVNTTHLSAPLQSQLGGGELGQNWFSGEHQVCGGWSSLDGAVGSTHSVGNRSNADESLLGVLSQHNQLHPGTAYDSMGYSERFIQSGTYGGLGALVPTASTVLPQVACPHDYLNGHEPAAPVKKNKIGWMSMAHQNSALEDSMGKPFLRSWNK